ncbi:MAG: SPFH/Band 7/PHB domain protein [Bacteroidales bacterium]|nr:SPFH/Band 7/PHB domain protein [Candidatus Colimorpha onthohippi]
MNYELLLLKATIIVLIIVYIISGITIVRQSTVKVIECLGKYYKTFSPGLHFILPIMIMKVRATVDMRETICDFRKQTIITKDNVKCEVDGIGFFKIKQPEKAIYAVSNYYESISQLMMTNMRNVFGMLTLDEAQVSRTEICKTMLQDINKITQAWGIEITNVEIQSITPPENIIQAMSLEMESERKKRSMILESEGEKAAIITRAEAKNRQVIIEAEAEKQKEVLEAEAKAKAQQISAEAQRRSFEELDCFIGNKENVRDFVLTMNYIESLKEMSHGENGKVVYMPYEATKFLASLGCATGIMDKGNKSNEFFMRD